MGAACCARRHPPAPSPARTSTSTKPSTKAPVFSAEREQKAEELAQLLNGQKVQEAVRKSIRAFAATPRFSSSDSGVDDEQAEEGFFISVLDRLEGADEFFSNSPDSKAVLDLQSEADTEGSDGGSDDEDYLLESYEPGDEAHAPLAEWELVATLNELRRRRLPKPSVAARLIRSVARLYGAGPSLVHIRRPAPGERIIVVGDLHGHFGDLLHILEEYGEPSDGPAGTKYLFNGDFVDRGMWGPEVLLTLYCLKLLHPNAVHFNRGNHEDTNQNRMAENGFRDVHCMRAFLKEGSALYRLCCRSFGQLPLCHVIGHEIAVVHGGLPLDPGVTLDEIRTLRRQRGVPAKLYSILGYRQNQRVRALRDLETECGHRIAKGSLGRLVGKSHSKACAVACFKSRPQEAVYVGVTGAPQLERDVELIFGSEKERRQDRSDRLFIALLWSDPICKGLDDLMGEHVAPGPNFMRGAGYFFDTRTTQAFLKTNGLRLLLRSHQKPEDDMEDSQYNSAGHPILMTVFSASNYPSGAGEPHGNKACVLLVSSQSRDTPLSVCSSPAWREPYWRMHRWTRPTTEGLISAGQKSPQTPAGGAEGGASPEEAPSARRQALERLWNMVYSARAALLDYFQSVDKTAEGFVAMSEWACAMRACILPDKGFPWERIAPYLADFDEQDQCSYGAFLARYQNVLSMRLEAQFCGKAMKQVLNKLGVQAEEAWDQLDRDGNGHLGYREFRPLLTRSRLFTGDGADADDDRAYTLLASMDSDHSGFVEREEFLNTVTRMPSKEVAGATIEHCWAALHGVLRVLASSRCEAAAIFQAMDTEEDGHLNRHEFRSGLERLLRRCALLRSLPDWEPLLWRLIDQDNSGSITPAELIAALSVVDLHEQAGVLGQRAASKEPAQRAASKEPAQRAPSEEPGQRAPSEGPGQRAPSEEPGQRAPSEEPPQDLPAPPPPETVA